MLVRGMKRFLVMILFLRTLKRPKYVLKRLKKRIIENKDSNKNRKNEHFHSVQRPEKRAKKPLTVVFL